MAMVEFAAALLVFLLSHSLPARLGLRQRIAARFGERAYQLGYSILSILLLAWLLSAALRAPVIPLWGLEIWQYHVPLAVMPVAFMLFAGGALSPNPLSFGFSRRRFDPDRPGIVGVTRHPLLWAFALWAFAHVVPNGDLVSLILFGGFGLFALAGFLIVDRRFRRQLGPDWERLAARTSIVPFAALLSGRAPWRWRAVDLAAAVLGGLFLYILFLALHPWLFGPDPAALLMAG